MIAFGAVCRLVVQDEHGMVLYNQLRRQMSALDLQRKLRDSGLRKRMRTCHYINGGRIALGDKGALKVFFSLGKLL